MNDKESPHGGANPLLRFALPLPGEVQAQRGRARNARAEDQDAARAVLAPVEWAARRRAVIVSRHLRSFPVYTRPPLSTVFWRPLSTPVTGRHTAA